MRLVPKHRIVTQKFLLAIVFVLSVPLHSYGDIKNGEQPNVSGMSIYDKQLKTIIVDNYYPYTFINKDGEPDGFSVDLIKAVAKVMELELEIRVDTWDQAMRALKTGGISFLPMMAYSSERDKLFDFSVPHTIAYDAFFTRKDSGTIRVVNDIRGKTIIVMKDDQAHDYLRSTGLIEPEKLILIDGLPEALRLLASGKGNAALMPKLVGLILIKNLNLTNLEQSPVVIETYKRPFSFAVKEGDLSLLERLSQGLSIVKATEQYSAIYAKWFGALELPGLSFRIFMKYIFGITLAFMLIVSVLILWSFSLRKQVTLRTRILEEEINERKQAEITLRESEERFRIAFENVSSGMALMANDGYFMKVNQTLCRILGYSEEELLSMTWVEITEPDDLDGCYDWLKRVKTGDQSAHEKRFIHKLGHPVWIMVSSSLVRDSQGRTRHYISLFQDITSRKQAEEALRESEQQLRAIFEAAIKVSFIITDAQDPEPTVLEFSPGAEKIFGYSKLEMVGNPVSILHLPSDVAKFPEVHRQMREGKIGFSGETTLVGKSGEKFPALFTTYPLFDEKGEMYAALGVSIDISEQKKLEAQLQQSQKMESIGTLAGGIAHDFNNILYPIIGYTEMSMEDLSEDSSILSNMKEVLKAAERAQDLVKQILAFSRKTELEKKPIQVRMIVKEVLKLLRASLPSTINIIQNITSSSVVEADPTQIHQIIMNLCTNAFHAMEETGGELTVTLSDVEIGSDDAGLIPYLKPGKYQQLTVSDTGHGMESAVLKKIFEPYFTTKKKDNKGTGMGLAVTHGIVKSHNGHISVNSEIGKGTAFHVYIPLTGSDATEDEKISTETIPRGNEHILLVDDEEQTVHMIQQMLERLGYRCTARFSSTGALEAFQTQPSKYDLVVTDLTMPNMTGDRFAGEIMNIRPDIPVILCTGFSEKMSGKKADALGIKGFLMKPIAKSDLAQTVRRVLDESKGYHP